jgi:hypothetical protein
LELIESGATGGQRFGASRKEEVEEDEEEEEEKREHGSLSIYICSD